MMSFTAYLVDDDASVLRALSRLVHMAGYEVRPYSSPRDFLRENDPSVPGCAIIDLTMPDLDLAVVTAVAILLPWLRGTARSLQPRPPLTFAVICERFHQLDLGASREEVEALLGPPTERGAHDPELEMAERKAEWSHRHLGIPRERSWERWIDTQDPQRWVAVLYAGTLIPHTVYEKYQHGLE